MTSTRHGAIAELHGDLGLRMQEQQQLAHALLEHEQPAHDLDAARGRAAHSRRRR
jgi:hypothetical protein